MEVQPISISSVLNDLKSGLTREQIGEKYNLNKAQVKRMFKNPHLKFKKTIKTQDPFVLIDDITPAPVAEPVVTEDSRQLNLIDAIEEAQMNSGEEVQEVAPVQQVEEDAPQHQTVETSTWS